MGEAKRKKIQGRQIADQLRERIAQGEFGPPHAARDYCLVLDKSAHGLALLQALRDGVGLDGVPELLATDALRFWTSSALLPFVVMRAGSGPAERRVQLAADAARLLALLGPQLAQGAASRERGLVLAIDESADDSLRRALAKLP